MAGDEPFPVQPCCGSSCHNNPDLRLAQPHNIQWFVTRFVPQLVTTTPDFRRGLSLATVDPAGHASAHDCRVGGLRMGGEQLGNTRHWPVSFATSNMAIHLFFWGVRVRSRSCQSDTEVFLNRRSQVRFLPGAPQQPLVQYCGRTSATATARRRDDLSHALCGLQPTLRRSRGELRTPSVASLARQPAWPRVNQRRLAWLRSD